MYPKPSLPRAPSPNAVAQVGDRRSFDAVFAVENPLHLQSRSPAANLPRQASPALEIEVAPEQQGPYGHIKEPRSDLAGGTTANNSSADADALVRDSSSCERRWRLDYSQFEAARKDPETAGTTRRRWMSKDSDPVIGYYRRQNETIDGFSEMDALEEHLLSPHRPVPAESAGFRLGKGEKLAVHLSNVLNILLLLAKIVASVESHSLSIIASTLDSLLDCLSGFILWYTARSMQRDNPYKYPIGKKRMQPLGIIVFSCIMAMLGLQILIEAIRQLLESSHNSGLGEKWQVYVAIMVLAIAVKLGLYIFCRRFPNEIVQAYAQDHFFDVVTNVVGLAAAVLAGAFAWWIDPLGAIVLSLYTMINWGRTVHENVKSLTGQSAPPEYLQKLTYLCWNHHEAILMIDTVRAYTFGGSYFTEVDVVLPKEMPLHEAHDIGESLQNKLELLAEIERAFVHLDYEVSHRPEHHAHAHFKAPPGGPSVGSSLGADDTASNDVQVEAG